mgnify:FL=1
MEQFLHKKEISHRLFFLTKYLDNFGKLVETENFPKTSMFTGNKGQGKYTLISHLLFSIKDDKYDNNNYQINKNSKFYNSFYSGINTNFICIDSSLIKIEDIRELKIKILSKKINNEKRFIVFDDIDLINLNCANALLKIIEEPLNNDYFFLINNKTQNLIETIKSRCIEFKIDMNFKGLNNNIQEFLKTFELKPLIDFDHNLLTPGLFLRFNQIMYEYNLDLNDTIYENFKKILNNHKRNKLRINIDLMKYIINFYFETENKSISKFQIIKIIDELFNYNLSQKTFLETVKNI